MYPPVIEKIINTNEISDLELLSKDGKIYSYINPVSYLEARKNIKLFQSMDGLLSDGIILVDAIKLLYGRKVRRRSADMTSLLSIILHNTCESIYFVGASETEINKSISILSDNFKTIKILGYRNGYFDSKEEIDLEYKKIIRLSPKYVVVGMGAIKQERFLEGLKKEGFRGIGISCGAFLSQLSRNGIKYYPTWINKYNLRFIYRFIKEKHTRKRYLKAAIMFPVLFLYDRLRYAIK